VVLARCSPADLGAESLGKGMASLTKSAVLSNRSPTDVIKDFVDLRRGFGHVMGSTIYGERKQKKQEANENQRETLSSSLQTSGLRETDRQII